MKTYIYLVRHGEVKNPEQIFYGRLPFFSLNKRGKIQTEKLSNYFKKIDIAAIYSSPLLRSRQTARSILKYHPKLKIHFSKFLLEWKNPLWEGRKYADRDHILSDIYINTPTKLKIKGAESMKDIEERMTKILKKILKKYKGKKVVIVSHGDPIRIATLHFKGEPLDNLHNHPCRNASITTLVFNDEKLVKLNYKEIHPRAEDNLWIKKINHSQGF